MDPEGDVRVTYYIAMWIIILMLSFFGFGLLCFKCTMVVRRIYSVLLFVVFGMLSVAEFITMHMTAKHYNDEVEFAWSVPERNELIAMNFAVWMVQSYILVNTA